MLTPEEIALAKRGNPRIMRVATLALMGRKVEALAWGHREEL